MKIITLLLVALSLSNLKAATITWSSSVYGVNGSIGQNLNTGVFNKTGTQVFAYNMAGSATTFDGISFAAASGSPFGSSLTISGLSGSFSGFHDGASPLSNTAVHGASNSVTTATLSNLVVGLEYRIQVLVMDARSGATGKTVKFDGISQGQYANSVTGNYGSGLLVTGSFLADSTTQSFIQECFSPTAGSVGGQYNAFLLHQIPEPSVALLSTLGILGFLRRRR
jgi:hypothetical protein